jgi:hypothetical protein
MAHAVQPNHKPHEQLRMEAPSQKSHSDKYVSAFTTGSATVDMTFRNPILPKSADHFKVGIDELTVNLGNLSMLEYGINEVLFRVLRRGNNLGEVAQDFQMVDGPVGKENQWRDAFEFKIDRPYLTILEIMERCTEVTRAVGTYMREEGLVDPVGGAPALWTLPLPADAGNFEHFRIRITANGQLKFSGNRHFWANFSIEVPEEKYRTLMLKDINQRYISLHPDSGNVVADPYPVQLPAGTITAHILAPPYLGFYGDPGHTTALEFICSGNLLNTLDRRVTLEVGCSLPLKNSPLVDHGEEAPDFVIGRFMLHQPYSMVSDTQYQNPEITVHQLGATTLQGPKDRVVYHHLQPQQKIQVLRLKLWARVRTFSRTTKTWGMKTIVCPVDDMDYWHLRLHFVEK